jgi:2'-5' RNA ligase
MARSTKQLLFIALLPPPAVNIAVNEIKQHFATIYQSRAALKYPPHITLQSPFYWQYDLLSELTTILQQFAKTITPISIVLHNFAAFEPRVIYINVIKTPELLLVQNRLTSELKSSLKIVDRVSEKCSFIPHITVGFKDISKAYFFKALAEFQKQNLHFEFTADELTLLGYNGQKWEIIDNFAFDR